MSKRKAAVNLIVWGILSLGLYGLLFAYADAVMRFFTQGGVGPAAALVVAAIVFSQIHGNFTGVFYEFLGIRPKGRSRR